jgi:hypothetical protein
MNRPTTVPPVCLICVSTRGCRLCADVRRACVNMDEAIMRRYPNLGDNPPWSMITSSDAPSVVGSI